ncbi:MAG: cytochrome ubiquinol oxidase subunit I [Chloroflexi bacterium]|nr:cytochrome ubiquinol oxidase subunit I [Chloroflexota bacterium]
MLDPVLLARIQFAWTVGFHYLFPALTLGLALVILALETLYLRKGEARYQAASSFWIKVLALTFVVGVATGITMEFSFGANWSEYSRFVGDIFGAPLAAEGIFAFFLESSFLAILLFGRKRVSKRVYWLAAFLVFIGSHISGLWILIANSWQQTPAGYALVGGRAELTSFWEAALNPSIVPRFFHTITGGWITGAFFVAGVSAWYLLQKRHQEFARLSLAVALAVGVLATLGQVGFGHAHAVQVALTQPAKIAAFEGLWETTRGAPLSLFGLPDVAQQKVHLFIGVPKLLSLMIHFDANAEVPGLNAFPRDDWPPVALPFYAYHLMVILGGWFIVAMLGAAYLLWRKRLETTPWALWALVLSIPLPQVANQVGWIAAEVGRQPWAVYGLLRTADAVSVTVPAGQVLATLIGFVLVYGLLFAAYLSMLLRRIRQGPAAQTVPVSAWAQRRRR